MVSGQLMLNDGFYRGQSWWNLDDNGETKLQFITVKKKCNAEESGRNCWRLSAW